MPQVSRAAPLDLQVRALIRKVLSGRDGSSVDSETERGVRAMLELLLEEARATGFKEARDSCTLCSMVRIEHSRSNSPIDEESDL